MKLMKFALAGMTVLTLCASSASAQLFERMPRLWQPEILRSGFQAPQDAPAPTPATESSELVLPEGATGVDGYHGGYSASYGDHGYGCDTCDSCNQGCGLFSWLRWDRGHSPFGGCNTCGYEAAPCCGPRKSFRLFSGSWFGHGNCCEPVCDTCDPCAKRGWLDKLFSHGARRDCHHEQTCCEPTPSCDCNCRPWRLSSLFKFGRRGHHGCDVCGQSHGYAPHGEFHFEDGHGVDDAPVNPPLPLPGNDLPAPVESDAI